MRLGGCGVRLLRSLLSLKPKATRTSRVRFRFIQGSMRVLFNKGCRRFLRAMVLEYWMESMLCNNYTSHLIDEYRKSSGKLVAVQSKSAKLSQRLKATAGS